ncbi:MAG: hypothetical protein Tsb0013_09010 [Phycisphaerales bacterium]
MKNRQHIIIGLHNDCVRVHVVRAGSLATSSRAQVESAPGREAWDDGLRAYDDALTRALDEAGVTGPASARVVYDSPTATVSAGPTHAPGRDGAEAALLELETRGGADLTVQSHAAWAMGRQADGSGYCVAVTDTPLTLETLSRFVSRAGITMLSATPTEAIGLAGALAMYRQAPPHGPRVCAWFGTWCAGVVVASESGVRFVRNSPMSLDALAHAMAGSGVDGNRLSSADTRTLLHEVGLPDTDYSGALPSGCTDVNLHEARASIQPLLQRTAVDLRQSLRFGLGKNEMEHARILAGGETSRVRGLVPLIAEFLGIESEVDSSLDDLSHVLEAIDRLRLVDDDQADSVHNGRLRRALWIGAAAALGVSVAQGLLAMDESSRNQEALSTLRAGTMSMAGITQRAEALEQEEISLARVERAINASVGFGPRWPGWLVDLADRCPERVVILGMSGTRAENDAGAVTMTGAVLPGQVLNPEPRPSSVDAGDTPTPAADNQMDVLSAFITSLESSPLIDRVELGTTRRGSALGEQATSFELTVTLRGAPSVAEVSDG